MTALKNLLLRSLAFLDRSANRLYGWRWNPFHASGTVVVLCLAIMLATGVYLLLFYRIGAPYDSVARLTERTWTGRWVRSLHRYAADLAIAAAALHAVRLFAQGRSWGPRALAWISGVALVALLLVCGWTGYVMLWDAQAQVLAAEGARLLDALPLASARISRTFAGADPLPPAFFFLNLFLHIALPIGIVIFLWLHVSRVARPVLLPPRPVLWSTVAILVLVSAAWPASLGPEADPLTLPGEVAVDVFYSFWVPLARSVSPAAFWSIAGALAAAALTVPLWSRPASERRPAPSRVSSRLCTACEQCYEDCPYDAIRMIDRTDGRQGQVAWVNSALCVSCGICAGSCAPMGVGPPGRTGRDQLAQVKALLARTEVRGRVVVAGCTKSAVGGRRKWGERFRFHPTGCAGNLHTSVVEYFVRAGADGVFVVACPPRDCWNREGPKWLLQRLFEGREAELQERVDRRRVRVLHAGAGDRKALEDALTSFADDVAALAGAGAEEDIDVEVECAASEGSRRPAARSAS